MRPEVVEGAMAGETVVPINPFLIPHVADKILSYLPPTKGLDLLTTRLVCRQWADSASKILRKKRCVLLSRYSTKVDKWAQLLELSKTSEFLPVANFTLKHDACTDANSVMLRDLFLNFAPVLESFAMWLDVQSNLKCDENSFFISDKTVANLKFPKLKRLTVDDQRSIFWSTRAMKCPFEDTGIKLIAWLIKSAPNLEQLVIQICRELDDNDVFELAEPIQTEIVKLFRDPDNKRMFLNLKVLQLDVFLNDDLLTCMGDLFYANRIPRLTSLQLFIKGSRFTSGPFNRLMSTLRHRLEELSLLSFTEKSTVAIQLPRMKELKTLEVSGIDRFHPNVTFHPVLHLPKLQKLIIHAWCIEKKSEWMTLITSNKPSLTVTELRLTDEVATFSNFIQISKSFPNLTKLDVKLGLRHTRVLEIIFDSLKLLACLRVENSWSWKITDRGRETHCGGNIDHILTGLPIEICNSIHQGRYHNLYGMQVAMQILPSLKEKLNKIKETKGRSGLTDLKYLRRLELIDLPHIATISDISGYFAFMEMQSLEYLDVNWSMMSFSCLNLLATKYPSNMEHQLTLMKKWISANKTKNKRQNYVDDVTDRNWVNTIPGTCNIA
ncbi:uncharacterized protein LOC110859862 [Folsomia candida]|nr:uncharacterized protein LOC110859862 [Folsomia candida]XP_021964571.1 uncharacterized protein LOC110859862 [Folsomia candida]XP_035715722.1 uncharacterized protein LOC110859862 [Folsomia candida]